VKEFSGLAIGSDRVTRAQMIQTLNLRPLALKILHEFRIFRVSGKARHQFTGNDSSQLRCRPIAWGEIRLSF